MLNYFKHSRNFCSYYALLLVNGNKANGNKLSSLSFSLVCSGQSRFFHGISIQNEFSLAHFHPNKCDVRFKSKDRNKVNLGSDSDDEFSDDDEVIENGEIDADGGRIKKARVMSLRVDLIVKAGFGISKRKAESCILSNKVKLNGKFIQKKGLQVKAGDELELLTHSADEPDAYAVQGKLSIKKIEALPQSLVYFIYMSVHKSA